MRQKYANEKSVKGALSPRQPDPSLGVLHAPIPESWDPALYE